MFLNATMNPINPVLELQLPLLYTSSEKKPLARVIANRQQ